MNCECCRLTACLLVQFLHMLDPALLDLACSLYSTSADQLTPLSGGHYNDVYQFPIVQTHQVSETSQVVNTGEVNEQAILRIGREDCPPEQTLAMLDWVSYLARNGAPVNAPLRSVGGNLLESLEFGGSRFTLTAFQKADGRLAENIPVVEWTRSLYRSIGKAVGHFHRVSAAYHPGESSFTRPHWFESYEITEALKKLSPTDPALGKLARLISELKGLPVPPSDYAMIHDDLHFANFLVRPDGTVTIIDFDDCGYGWFAIDVAMALFDVLVLYDPATDSQAQEFSREFLSNYLAGYREEYPLSAYWQAQIPRFLKLKELCIYADLFDHPDAGRLGTWVGNFMRGRAVRIANDLPYVDINFAEL